PIRRRSERTKRRLDCVSVLRRRSSVCARRATLWFAWRPQRSILREYSVQMEPVGDVCLRGGLLPHARRFSRGIVAAISRDSELHYTQRSFGVCGNLYILNS